MFRVNNAALATQRPIQPLMLAPLGSLVLNYQQLQCLDMAIDFLDKQIKSVVRHKALSKLHKSHVESLKRWLRVPELRSQARFDNSTHAIWAVDSSEDVKWLKIALKVGVNTKAVWKAAKEAADYEYDMAVGLDEVPHYQGASRIDSQALSNFFYYYHDVANCKHALLKQLRNL